MTPLRQRFSDELQLRNYSKHTLRRYVSAVADLAGHYHRSPDKITDEEVKSYLLHLWRERELAASSIIISISALRFLFRHVLQRPTEAMEKALPPVRRPQKLPRVYSVSELEQIFGCPDLRPKERAVLMTAYGAGLRVSEVCALRVQDLLSDRGQIQVVQAKGQKDRYTLFAPGLQEQLRAYWRVYRPEHWLFPSQVDPARPLAHGCAQVAFRRAVQKVGLPIRGGFHCLRHSFATHLLEGGVDILTIQALLGHNCLATTAKYIHVRQQRLTKISSALDLIGFNPTARPEGRP
jgi:integrase/recombinase XerD